MAVLKKMFSLKTLKQKRAEIQVIELNYYM